MTNQNLIHLKLEYEEAVEAKKKILSLERDSLNIAQAIKNYHSLRINELNAKAKLHNKIKVLLTDIRKLQRILPKVDVEKVLKEKGEKLPETKTKEKKYNSDIESQLKEIQNKLNSLNR